MTDNQDEGVDYLKAQLRGIDHRLRVLKAELTGIGSFFVSMMGAQYAGQGYFRSVLISCAIASVLTFLDYKRWSLNGGKD